MAVNTAIDATRARRAGRCKAAWHQQRNRSAAEAVFVQHHVAPAVHSHLLAGKAQIANSKPLAQQIGIAIAEVGKIRHEIIPLQAYFLGQISIEIQVVAVGNHAYAWPVARSFVFFFVKAMQIVAHEGAQHLQIVYGNHHERIVHDGFDLVLLQQGFKPLEHGCPADLIGLVERAAQGVQHGKPRLSGGIGHAHVNRHGGPVHTRHALPPGTALKGDAG